MSIAFWQGFIFTTIIIGVYHLIGWIMRKKYWKNNNPKQTSIKERMSKKKFPDSKDVIAVKAMTALIESGRYEENIKVCENYEEAATRTSIQAYELANAMIKQSENE